VEKGRFLPPTFDLTLASYKLALQQRVLAGLLAIDYPLYPYNLSPDDIYMNMGHFLKGEETFIMGLLQQETKPQYQTPRLEDIHLTPYALSSELYEMSPNKPPHHFFRDTHYGVTFYQGDCTLGDAAHIGFELLTSRQILELKSDPFTPYIEKYREDPNKLACRQPVITQLQGPTYRDLKSVEPVLKNLRWERILVNLISFWAQRVGFPCIYFTRGEYNIYYNPTHKPELAKRLTRRYNGTAKKCGFRRDPITGLYKKGLGVYETV
jgi:hypothetical protein